MKARFNNFKYYMAMDNYYHLVLPDFENHRAYDFTDDKFYMANRGGYLPTINVCEKDFCLYPKDELIYDLDLVRSFDSVDIRGYLLQKKILKSVEKAMFGNKGLTLSQLQTLNDNMLKLQDTRYSVYKTINKKEEEKKSVRREVLDDLFEEKNR